MTIQVSDLSTGGSKSKFDLSLSITGNTDGDADGVDSDGGIGLKYGSLIE